MMSREHGPTSQMMALLVGLALVLLLASRGCGGDDNRILQSRFAASSATEQARATAGEPLIPLPESVRELASTTTARLRGGEQVIPITPVATNDQLKVDIHSLQQVANGLQIKGTVTNKGKTPLLVPLAAFHFIDQTGTMYAAQGDAAATLPPGGSTTLDLTLPIDNPTTLMMVVELPEANVRLEMQLLVPASS